MRAREFKSVITIFLSLAAYAAFCALPAGNDRWGKTEYAVRWYTNKGGPASVKDVLKILTGTENLPDKKIELFSIRYFDWTAKVDVPDGLKPILRERIQNPDGKKLHELTYKIRSESPFDAVNDHCLISGTKEKNEVDASVISGSAVQRAYSYSCTLTAEKEIRVPDTAPAKAKPCQASMTRISYKTNGVKTKVELWELPGETAMIEVSRSGSSSDKDLKDFLGQIAAPLIAAKINPVLEGKTIVASNCPGA